LVFIAHYSNPWRRQVPPGILWRGTIIFSEARAPRTK
jgi:hypothetical protein